MKKAFFVMTLASSVLFAKQYTGCADTKQNAVANLSKNILLTVNTNTDISKIATNSSYNKTIVIKNNQSSNIQLTNINFKEDGDKFCAYVDAKEQHAYLTKIKKEILLYDIKDLPKQIDLKIDMINLRLPKISQLLSLYTIFDVNLDEKEILKLNQLNKKLSDERTKLLLLQDEKIWKGCGKDKLESMVALDKIIFNTKIQKAQEKSFWDNFVSSFSSLDENDLSVNILKNFIYQDVKDKQVCSYIEKDKILYETKSMYSKIDGFNKKNLPANPKEKIKVIDVWLNELNIINLLVSLFPQEFNIDHTSKIANTKKELNELRKSINPQFVKFISIDSGDDVKILLDKKYKVVPNEESYIKSGKHIFTATTKDKCPINDTFDIKYNEDKNIELSFEDSLYPTVLFNSNKFDAKLSIDGNIYNVAKKYSIPVCDASVPYIITYGEQSYHGTLELKKNQNIVKQFDFLSALEIETFNDSQAKQFSVDMNKAYQGNLSNEKLMSSLLKFSVTTSPSNGSIDLDERGAFIYTPNKNYKGDDSFKYKINTASDESAEKLVQITVVGTNRKPKGLLETINMIQGKEYETTIEATDEDEDELVFKLSSKSKNAEIVIQKDGDLIYKPNKDFYGVDTFSYTVSDSIGDFDTKTVTVTISKNNTLPEAKNITVQTKQKLSKDIKLLGSDKDHDTLKFIITNDVQNGGLECSKSGVCKYTPLSDFSGKDSFQYKVSDGIGQSNIATVTIDVVSSLEKVKVKIEENKKDEVKKDIELNEEDYKQLKEYLEHLFNTKDEKTIFQLKEKYPNSFERFISEKTGM